MARVDDLLVKALKELPPKPTDDALRDAKQKYSQQVTMNIALAFAEELRQRGLRDTRPGPPGMPGLSGAERRMSGGIGAKRVDVTWTTEESGLLLAISLKSINFKDARSQNYQKNLTNRRGDMLFEAVTLHRRFPYAVLGGFLFLDKGAAEDGSGTRRSTFLNAHRAFRLFSGRTDPAGRDEQYELLYVSLVDANPFGPWTQHHLAGEPSEPTELSAAFDGLIGLIAERNPDFYEAVGGELQKHGL